MRLKNRNLENLEISNVFNFLIFLEIEEKRFIHRKRESEFEIGEIKISKFWIKKFVIKKSSVQCVHRIEINHP